jgi:hypothetical protein
MAVGTAAAIANSILDALLRSTAWSEPAAVYGKLHTGDPGAAGTSNAATHTTRVQFDFGAASGGAATNSGDETFSSLAASETISHLSFWDASSGGNFLFSVALASSKAVDAGGSLTIPAGELDVSLTVIAS